MQGLPFSQSDWDRTKDAALRALIARRYPAGRVQNSLADIDADNRQANLYIELDSGRAFQMGEVVVEWKQGARAGAFTLEDSKQLPSPPWDFSWSPLSGKGAVSFRRWLPVPG